MRGAKRPPPETDINRVYKQEERAGSGTYGIVYLATRLEDSLAVAIKKLRLTRKEKNASFLARREISILTAVQSTHVVRLIDVMETQDTTFLVMERMQHDLRGLLQAPDLSRFWPRTHIKNYAHQILSALHFCHSHNYIHRDLKPENILVSRDNTLKLADFGLATIIRSDGGGGYTNPIATRWYRPLEIFYGSRIYGPEVDIWAAGCIFGELLQNSVFFPGTTDQQQPICILTLCGTPLENGWPEAALLPKWIAPTTQVKRDFRRSLITENKLVSRKMFFSPVAVDLLDQMLQLMPERRATAVAALNHDYFANTAVDGVELIDRQLLIRYNSDSHFARNK
jgi:serine/threonine protein kinase